jgi:hypothetical protein
VKVFTELVRIPEGPTLMKLFGDMCNGGDSQVDFAKHVDLVADSHFASSKDTKASSDSMVATDTVFLLIRNECPGVITVSVDHDIHILVPLSLQGIRNLLQARLSPSQYGVQSGGASRSTRVLQACIQLELQVVIMSNAAHIMEVHAGMLAAHNSA